VLHVVGVDRNGPGGVGRHLRGDVLLDETVQVGARSHVGPPSSTATNDLLRDLEALGYLRLERDPTDGRARTIRYTDRGWSLFRTGSRVSHDIGRRWAQAVGQRRYDQFRATLRAIVELGGPP